MDFGQVTQDNGSDTACAFKVSHHGNCSCHAVRTLWPKMPVLRAHRHLWDRHIHEFGGLGHKTRGLVFITSHPGITGFVKVGHKAKAVRVLPHTFSFVAQFRHKLGGLLLGTQPGVLQAFPKSPGDMFSMARRGGSTECWLPRGCVFVVYTLAVAWQYFLPFSVLRCSDGSSHITNPPSFFLGTLRSWVREEARRLLARL